MTFIYGALSQKHYGPGEWRTCHLTFAISPSRHLSLTLCFIAILILFTNNLQDYGMNVRQYGVFDMITAHSVSSHSLFTFRIRCVCQVTFWWTTYVKLFSVKIIMLASRSGSGNAWIAHEKWNCGCDKMDHVLDVVDAERETESGKMKGSDVALDLDSKRSNT